MPDGTDGVPIAAPGIQPGLEGYVIGGPGYGAGQGGLFAPGAGGGLFGGTGDAVITGGTASTARTVDGTGLAMGNGGPGAANFFESGQGGLGAGGAEIAAAPKIGEGGAAAQGALDKPGTAKLTFGETDPSKAHILVDSKGDVTLNEKNMPKAGDKELKAYLDPKFAGGKPDAAQLNSVIDKANAKLAEKGIKTTIEKPSNAADMAALTKAAEQAQAKAAEGKKPSERKPRENRPVPSGNSSGGDGGKAPDRQQREQNKQKNRKSKDANEKAPESFEKMSALVDKNGGLNKGSNADFVQAVYGSIPGYDGLMSELDAIENSNMTPEEKAAARAKATSKFQKDHAKEITDNTAKYAKESGDSFLRDQDKAGFDSIGKNLADESKAGAIADMLTHKDKAADASVKAIFDEQGQKAIKDTALLEGATWKDATDAEKDKQAGLVGKLGTEAFKFNRL